MKLASIVLTLSLIMGGSIALAPAAQAVGCLSGGAVGAVGGHLAGHHAVLGAVGGCIVGHHMKMEQKKKAAAAAQASQQQQYQQQGAHPAQ